VLASALLGLLLYWGAHHFDWVALRTEKLQRIGLLAALIAAAALIYFSALALLGVKLRSFIKR